MKVLQNENESAAMYANHTLVTSIFIFNSKFVIFLLFCISQLSMASGVGCVDRLKLDIVECIT